MSKGAKKSHAKGHSASKKVESSETSTTATKGARQTKDSTVQFRLDSDKMELLSTVAKERRTGAGVLARMWVLERLEKETSSKEGQFDPMVVMADSIKALASALGVNDLSSEVKARIGEVEQKVKDKATKVLPSSQEISKQINSRLDELEQQIKQKTDITLPRVNEISDELSRRLDALEEKLQEKTGVNLPRSGDISVEVNKRLDQVEKQLKEKMGLNIPSVDEISQGIDKRIEQIESQLKQSGSVSFPRVDDISREINKRIDQIEAQLKPRTGVSLPRVTVANGKKKLPKVAVAKVVGGEDGESRKKKSTDVE